MKKPFAFFLLHFKIPFVLLSLAAKNFALLDSVRIEFGRGLNVLSGETGAGKSILIGSLHVLLGAKASPAWVRSGENEAVIEAQFDAPYLREALEERGLFEDDNLIVRRHVSQEGKSRVYVNDRMVTVGQLKELSPFLVDLSGQHDQQVLLDAKNHPAIFDGVAASLDASFAKVVEAYHSLFEPYAQLKQQLAELRQKSRDRLSTLEFLKFQIAEIAKAGLTDPLEEDKLIVERLRVKNADSLLMLASRASNQLYESDQSVLSTLDLLLGQITEAATKDATLEEVRDPLVNACESLRQVSDFFRSYLANIQADPDRLEQIESRLFTLHQLQKKYGPGLGDVLTKRTAFESEYAELLGVDDVVAGKQKELADLEQKLMAQAAKLSGLRALLAPKFAADIMNQLAELSMPGARFKIELGTMDNPKPENLKSNGLENMVFYLSSNKGESFKPLAQVASGGELSRILLAIKTVFLNRDDTKTYVFDEIDAGIGGGVAHVVGQKLKHISQKRQVICVTHLPQIAALADQHFVIEKAPHAGRTRTTVKILANRSDRVGEIARMLGGATITAKTRAHAGEMVDETSPSPHAPSPQGRGKY